MAGLGPWPEDRRIAVAVSGGADSSALALLAAELGPAARADRRSPAATRLGRRGGGDGTASRPAGHSLARAAPRRAAPRRRPARTRPAARGTAALGRSVPRGRPSATSCSAITPAIRPRRCLMRTRRGSGPRGRAGMAAIIATRDACLIRPLLGVAPARLRATLRAARLAWVEDPTNRDWHFLRPRLRAELAAADPAALLEAAAGAGQRAGGSRIRRSRRNSRLAPPSGRRVSRWSRQGRFPPPPSRRWSNRSRGPRTRRAPPPSRPARRHPAQ